MRAEQTSDPETAVQQSQAEMRAVEARIAEQLAGAARPRLVAGAMVASPPYVRRYAMQHVAAGGVLDERFIAHDFLPYVDAPRLRALAASTDRAADLLRLWRQVAYAWRWDTAAANADALRFWMAACGEGSDAVAGMHAVWEPCWVRWRADRSETIGRHASPVLAVAAAVLPDGRVVAVTGGWDATVRVWDLTTGAGVGEPMSGHTDIVAAEVTPMVRTPRSVSGTRGRSSRRWRG